MENIGFLWDKEVEWDGENPFNGDRSKDFAKYTEIGEEHGLKIFIAHYSWYRNGSLEKAFYWNGSSWEKVHDIELNGVYDKFKYTPETRKLKEKIAEETKIVNDVELEELCKDKLKTYETFPKYVPETRKASKHNLIEMLEENKKVVFKPRYGFAGEGVHIIESVEEFEEPEKVDNYILQEFIETEGIQELGVEGPHDLRTIVIDGEIQDGNYVRVPDEGLISNISRGGDQVYVDKDELPEEIVEIIDDMRSEFECFQPAIFSVDFMLDNNGRPWIVELNSKPGTYYHHSVKDKEKEIPKIRNILRMLEKRFV